MNSASQPTRRRRWLRFGLRTLLVLLTVACVWLAIVFNQCRRQRRAVEAIEQAGGRVLYKHQLEDEPDPFVPFDDDRVPGPKWLRSITGDDLFRSPQMVEINGSSIDEQFLTNHLSGVRTARWLAIDSSRATDASLAAIVQFSNMESLELNTPLITDATMTRIGSMTCVESVDLDCPHVTDEGLARLADLKGLWQLYIASPKVTAEGIRRLEGLQQLRVVKIVRDPRNEKLVEQLWNLPAFVEFVETPLHEALDGIVADWHVSIDRRLIPDDAQRAFISFKCDDPLGVALEGILQPFGMNFYLDGGTVRIVPAAEAMARRPGYVAVRETFPKAKLILVDW